MVERMAVSQLINASSFLEWLLARTSVKQAITEEGYFEMDRAELSPAFEQCRDRQWGRLKRLGLFSTRPPIAPSSFSTDFYSQIPPALEENGLYLLRKGGG